MTTREGFRAGWAHWGVLLRIALLYFAATVGSVALLAAPCVIALLSPRPVGAVLFGIPALLIAVPWFVTLYLVQAFASRIAVLENRRALDAIGKARLFLHGRLMHGLKLMVAIVRRHARDRARRHRGDRAGGAAAGGVVPVMHVFPVIVARVPRAAAGALRAHGDDRHVPVLDLDHRLRDAGGSVIAAACRRPGAPASPLEALFATLSSRLGGDAEPLAEDAIARLVEAGACRRHRRAPGAVHAARRSRVSHRARHAAIRRRRRGRDPGRDADGADVARTGTRRAPTRASRPGSRPSPSTRRAGGSAAAGPSSPPRASCRTRPATPAIRPTTSTARGSGARCSSRSRSCPSASARSSACATAPSSTRARSAAAVGIEAATIRKILERTRTRLGERIDALLSPEGGRS